MKKPANERVYATSHISNPIVSIPATMNGSFRFARLRIGTSALFLGVFLFLTALWVRSYWRSDSLVAHLPGMSSVSIDSDAGEMRIALVPLPLDWTIESKEKSSALGTSARPSLSGHVSSVLPWGPMITLPHWYLALVSLVVASLPWIRWRILFRRHSRSTTNEPHYYGNLQSAA
jgi:hypothetical protein